jgi:integrase
VGKRIRREAWETSLAESVSSLCKGWSIRSDHGNVVLSIRSLNQHASLGFKWEKRNSDDVRRRIDKIFVLVEQGKSFKEAVKIAKGKAPKLSHQYNWEETIENYREHKGSRVKDETWRKKYVPVFTYAQKALKSRRPPTNGPDLCDACLKNWTKGTRQRQIMSQSLKGLLEYAVWRKNFPHCWLPLGEVESVTTEKRVGYPLTDSQILRLLDSLPEGPVHDRWRFAIQLLAVYGLRPEGLRHLVTRNGGRELWCMYRKSKGGTKGKKTEPRRLYPLLVYGDDGPVEWNLLDRVHIGEELPPLGKEGKGSHAVKTYLNRRPMWNTIKEEAKAEHQSCTPYSFRHRFSASGHARGGVSKVIADGMGHVLDTHLSSYARFATRDMEKAFDQMNSDQWPDPE